MNSTAAIENIAQTVELSVEGQMIKEGDYFVSYCPALELSSYGESPDDARAAFEEVLKIFIDDAQAKGTLEKILLDLGWTLKKYPIASFVPPLLNMDKAQYDMHQSTFKERIKIFI